MKKTRDLPFFTIALVVGSLTVFGMAELHAASTPKPTPKTTAKATPKATAKATPKPKTTAKATPKPTGAAGARGSSRFGTITTAQRACLKKEGITLPTPRANAPRPTSSPRPTARPTGGAGFGGGGTFTNSPKTVAAFKKCGITLPTPGAGFGGGNFDVKKFQAFQTCMTKAGIKATNGFRYDQSDPDTAVALIKCQKSSGFKLPTFGQRGANS
ncbi:MAG: hypothetical protein WDO06_04120 [Actinomycetota bacterium]